VRRNAAWPLYERAWLRRGLFSLTAAVSAILGAGSIVVLHPNPWLAVAVETGLGLAAITLALTLRLLNRIRAVRPMKKTQASPERALARFYVRNLTDLAAWLAGPKRLALRDEWRAHLAGEGGHDPITRRKVWNALGFVVSAIRFRLADAADLAWRPADAVLGSRTLSNLFVWGPVIATLVAIVRHDGRFGLVADDQDPVALGAFLYVVIKTGRWWRGVKPPEPRARRTRE